MSIPRLSRPPSYYVGRDLFGVVAPAVYAAWAVGRDEVLRWDGRRWHRTGAPAGTYYAVGASNPRDVWAVGTKLQGAPYGFIVAHWNGVKRQRIPMTVRSPRGATLFTYPKAVLVLDSHDVWVVGGPPPFAAHWNGKTWTSYPVPGKPDQTSALDSLVKGPSDTIYAAGDGGMYAWSNGAWIATDYRLYHDYYTDPVTISRDELWGVAPLDAGDQFVWLKGSAWVPVGNVVRGRELTAITADSHGDIWGVGDIRFSRPRPPVVHYHC